MPSFADPPGGSPYQGSQSQGGDETRNVNVNLGANVSGYAQNMDQAAASTDKASKSVDTLTSKLDGLSKRAGSKLIHIGVGDFAALGGAVASAASLEKQLSTLRATAAVTGTSMGQTKTQIDAVFDKFPVHRAQVIALTEAIANMGVTKPSAIGADTATFTKLGAATGESATGLASGGIQLGRQLDTLDPTRVEKYSNALLVLSKNQGVAASSIQDFSSAIAPIARQAGIGQAAIMGIAAAFQKSGADGAQASTMFNGIMQDITQLSRTGSPGIAKYANAAGVSSATFRSMSGENQFSSVINAIGNGGAKGQRFADSLGLSPRQFSSIQAVAQSGAISSSIAQSQAASQNTNALDTGSAAAFSGLTDDIAHVRNEFTQLATEIGEPLLKPISMFVNVVGEGAHLFNDLVKAMGPLPAIMGSVAGVAAVGGGLALKGAAVAGTIALGRHVFGQGSLIRQGLSAGRATGAAVFGGMSEADAMASTDFGRRIAASKTLGGEKVPLRASVPFFMSMESSRGGPTKLGGVASRIGGVFGAGMQRGAGGAVDLGMYLANSQAQFNRDSTKYGFEKESSNPLRSRPAQPMAGRSRLRRAAGAVGNLMGSSIEATTGAMSAAGTAIGEREGAGVASKVGGRLLYGAGLAAGGIGKGIGAASKFMFSPAGMIASMVGIPLISAGVNYLSQKNAQFHNVDGSTSGAAGYDQALDKTSSNLAKFGDSVSSASDRLTKFANTPLKDLTTVTSADTTAASAAGFTPSDPNLAAIYKASNGDPKAIGAYLATKGVQGATAAGDQFTGTKQDLAHFFGAKGSTPLKSILDAYVKAGISPTGGATGTTFMPLGALASGVTNPEDFKSILGTGIAGVTAAAQNGGAQGPPSQFSNVIRLAGLASGSAGGSPNSVQQQLVMDELSKKLPGIDRSKLPGAIDAASKSLGFQTLVAHAAGKGSVLSVNDFSNASQASQVYAKAIGSMPNVAALLAKGGMTPEQLVASVASSKPMAFPGPQQDEAFKNLAGKGRLGAAIVANPLSAKAVANPADLGLQHQTIQSIIAATKSTTGAQTYGDVALHLQEVTRQAGGASSELGALTNAAAVAATGLMSIDAATQTRGQRAAAAGHQAVVLQNEVAASGGAGGGASPELMNASTTATQNAQEAGVGLLGGAQSMLKQVTEFNTNRLRSVADNNLAVSRSNQAFSLQEGQSQLEYNKSRARTIQDYGTQVVRSEEDFDLQRLHQLRDFHTQAARSETDFETSRTRQVQDYNTSTSRNLADFQKDRARQIQDYDIQQQRAEADYELQTTRQVTDAATQRARTLQDFQTQQLRSTDDFNIQLARQAEKAAQSIYDPYQRTQREATTSAGLLVRNLSTQNADIQKQIANLQQISKMGVSDQSIKTLNLADPAKAQQLDALLKSLQHAPQLISQINAQVTQRVAGTTQLTQSPYNEDFKNQVDDFNKSQARAQQDLDLSMSRSDSDLQLSLSRSATDFAKSTSRSLDDLQKSLTRGLTDYQLSVTRGSQDLHLSLTRDAADFSLSATRAVADLKIALADASQQFSISADRAAADEQKSLSRMATDFSDTESIAVRQHNIQLNQMATDFKTSQTRAGEDLAASFAQYTANFQTTISKLMAFATGSMATYAPGAAKALVTAINDYAAGMSALVGVDGMGMFAGGAPSVPIGIVSHLPGGSPRYSYANGGISLTNQVANVSENGPEAHIPLNSNGENFMAGLIAKSLAKGITMAVSQAPQMSSSQSNDNSVSFSGADITVVAQDPNKMARELAKQAQIRRLMQPVH